MLKSAEEDGAAVIRPFDPATDYRWLTEWWNAENGDEPRLESEFRKYDELREPKYFFERWTCPGLWTGSVGHNSWAHEEDRYAMEVEMDPASGLDPYREAVKWGISKIEARAGKELSMWGRDDRERTGVLESLGFKVIESIPVTRLNLATFDPASVAHRRAGLESEGIRFCTVADLNSEAVDWMPLLYESSWEITQDIPAAYTPTQPPYEDFVRRFQNSDEHDPDLMWVAMDEGRIVGYSRLAPSKSDAARWRTGMSGVVRSHRRRGIVTVLKVIGATEAKRRGAVSIQTENADVNPMLDVNLRMGYRESHKALFLEKKL